MITRNLFNNRFLLAPASGAPAAGGQAPVANRNLVGALFGDDEAPAPPKVTDKDIPAKAKKSSDDLDADDEGIFGEDKGGKTPKAKSNPDDEEDALTDDEEDTEKTEDSEDVNLDTPLAPEPGKKAVSGKDSRDIRANLETISKQAKKHAAENEALRKKLAAYEKVATESDIADEEEVTPVDVEKDETFQKHKTSIVTRLDINIGTVDNDLATEWADKPGVFSATLESYSRDLRAAKTATDKSRVTKELREKLAKKFTDEDKEIDGKPAAAKIISILAESIPDLESMYSRVDELNKKTTSNKDRGSVYSVRRTAAEELVAGAGDYPDSVVTDHPHSVAAYLHSLKAHPKFKPRLDMARKNVADLLAGPPELTKAEKASLEKSGGAELVTKTVQQRRQVWTQNRSKMAVKLVEALLFLPQAGDILKKLNEATNRVEDEDYDRSLIEDVRSERGGDKLSSPPARKISPQRKLIQDLFS